MPIHHHSPPHAIPMTYPIPHPHHTLTIPIPHPYHNHTITFAISTVLISSSSTLIITIGMLNCSIVRITTMSRFIIITAFIVTISIVICDYPAPAHRSCNPLKLLHLFALPSSTPVQMQSPWQASSDAAATEHTGEPQLAGHVHTHAVNYDGNATEHANAGSSSGEWPIVAT